MMKLGVGGEEEEVVAYFKHYSGILSGGSEKNTKSSEFSCLDQDFNPGFLEYGALLLLTTAIFGLCICLDAV
jgi:hypothetical protein